MIGLYQIKNTANGKCYYGSSSDLKRREGEHFRKLKINKHYNAHLQSSYNIYGDVFEFDVVYECEENDLLKYEQILLDYNFKYHKGGYNKAKVAEAPARGLIRSDETRKKMSEAKKGNPMPIGIKNKISESKKGHLVSSQTRGKISESMKGMICSDETRKKMSEARKGKKNWNWGKPWSDEIRKKMSDAKKCITGFQGLGWIKDQKVWKAWVNIDGKRKQKQSKHMIAVYRWRQKILKEAS